MAPADTAQLARSRFDALPLPGKDDESWRKFNVTLFDLNAFHYDSETKLSAEFTGNVQPRQNESVHLFEARNKIDGLHQTLVQKSGQYSASGVCTLRIRHSTSGDSLVHNVNVRVESGAELTLIEEFDSADTSPDKPQVWSSLTEVEVGAGAIVRYMGIRKYTGAQWNFHRVEFKQSRDSQVHSSIVHSGGIAGKTFVNSHILEPGGTFRGIGMTTLRAREFLDMEMVVEHTADNSSSSLEYKTIVRDRAHSIFNGNLIIPPGVKKVQSRQMNRNILLDTRARAESQPRLVIQSEEVSCEHGATVGELDKDTLFYLMSRGLSEEDARKLIITGFLAEICDEFPVEETERLDILSAFLGRLN